MAFSTTTYKARALGEILQKDLAIRLATMAAAGNTLSFDTNGNPVISLGDGVATHANVVIRVESTASINTDILGLTQTVFTPHIIQVCWEDVSGAGAHPLGFANELAVLGEVLGKGTRVELYVTATTVLPSTSGMVSGNLKGSFDSLQYPLLATI